MRPDQIALLQTASHEQLQQIAHWATFFEIVFGDVSLRSITAEALSEMTQRSQGADMKPLVVWMVEGEEIQH